MGQFFWNLAGWLAPPPVDADAQQLRRWRVTVAVVTMTNTVGTIGAVVLALGLVPFITSGFAPAAKLEGTQLQLAQLQVNQLDTKILDTRTRQCDAGRKRANGDPEAENAVRFATGRLQEQLNEFFKLTGRTYRLPDCSEV